MTYGVPCDDSKVKVDGNGCVDFPDLELPDVILLVECGHGLFVEERFDAFCKFGEDFNSV